MGPIAMNSIGPSLRKGSRGFGTSKRVRNAPGIVTAVPRLMCELNASAARAARAAGAHALTDVTGFGLLAHLHELAAASGCAAEVEAAALPPIDGVLELLARDDERAIAGGTRRNRAYGDGFATFADLVDEARRWLACDAMTSGGLA